SGVQRLLTPDYDCRGRSGVHVVFHSGMEQAGETITALEYTVDGGKTWLPADYRVNSVHVFLDSGGKIDAVETLTKPTPGAPLFFDAEGLPHGTTYGEVLGARVGRALDAFIQGLRRNQMAEGKRVEVYRLKEADGQRRVQLRFLQAGRFGW